MYILCNINFICIVRRDISYVKDDEEKREEEEEEERASLTWIRFEK